MKAVLLSVRPTYCEKIASGKKTIEVRKSRPKLETPFKVYIYCAKGKDLLREVECWNTKTKIHKTIYKIINLDYNANKIANGKVIGEFICDRIDKYTAEFVKDGDCYEDVRRVWVDDEGEENFEIVTGNYRGNPEDCELLKQSCLSYVELKKYIGENFHDRPFYTWHISKLKIYNKPKQLNDFKRPCPYTDGTHCIQQKCEFYGDWSGVCRNWMERPPQSWCYVEELGNG